LEGDKPGTKIDKLESTEMQVDRELSTYLVTGQERLLEALGHSYLELPYACSDS
jgi:hypothetical protein